MLNQFTFQYHPFELIQNNIDTFLEGTIRCDTFIYDDKQKKPVVKSINYFEKESTLKEDKFLEYQDRIIGLMKSPIGTKWHLNKEFKWLIKDQDNLEMSLFVKPTVLQINITNQSNSGLHDVILFYFPNNLANFKLTDTEETKGLTAGEQRLIEKIILQVIALIRKNIESDITNWADLFSHFKQQELELMQLKADTEKRISGFSKSILKHCQQQLDKIALEKGLELRFSDELTEKLKTLHEVPLSIYDDIDKAIKICRLKNQQSKKKQLTIGATDLTITMEQQEIKAAEDQTIEIQMRAPYSFLERIETAMQLLDYQRKPFTGENVGAYMKPTVTKSAITQYRNSHQEDLIQLLTIHPGKWTLTRNHFKPIKNLLDNLNLAQKNKRAANN